MPMSLASPTKCPSSSHLPLTCYLPLICAYTDWLFWSPLHAHVLSISCPMPILLTPHSCLHSPAYPYPCPPAPLLSSSCNLTTGYSDLLLPYYVFLLKPHSCVTGLRSVYPYVKPDYIVVLFSSTFFKFFLLLTLYIFYNSSKYWQYSGGATRICVEGTE